MIVMRKVTPMIVQRHWDSYFRKIILLETPPGVTDHAFRASNTLKAICEGRLTVWAMKFDGEIQAIMSTYPAFENLAGSKALIIYSAYGTGNMNKKALSIVLDTLKKEAKELGCTTLLLNTQLPSVVKVGEAMGAKRYFTLTLEVK
jgi:hypothetical protein